MISRVVDTWNASCIISFPIRAPMTSAILQFNVRKGEKSPHRVQGDCNACNQNSSTNSISNQLPSDPRQTRKTSSTTSVMHIRNNSWEDPHCKIGHSTTFEANKHRDAHVLSNSLNKVNNSQTLKPPRSDDRYCEETVTQFFSSRAQYFADKGTYEATEDIEEESDGPRKPNPTVAARRPLRINSYYSTVKKYDDKTRLSCGNTPSSQKLSHLEFKAPTPMSTGISGSESTPSNFGSDQKWTNLTKPSDSISLELTTQNSDFDLYSLSTQEKLPEERKVEFESKPLLDENTIKLELENFNPIIEPCVMDNDTIEFLIEREREYLPDPQYLKLKQPHVTWLMRAILVDWMFEVSMEFTLKRETFHFALNYVDRFLSIFHNIPKQELQLVGVTALFIAAKSEEVFSFRVEDFAKACDDAYTKEQILHNEVLMLKKLKWTLVPPTLNTWAQWYLSQWDLFIEQSPLATTHPFIMSFENGGLVVQFRQPTEQSYKLFREIMQYIDCITLEVEHLQYNQRTLIAALMYLILGREYKQFPSRHITEEFRNDSSHLFNKQSVFNAFFGKFLESTFGFDLDELLPSAQYLAPFFKLPLSFELPRAVQLLGGESFDVK